VATDKHRFIYVTAFCRQFELSHVTSSSDAFSAQHQPCHCKRRHTRTRTDLPPYVREGRRDHQKAASKFNIVRDLHTGSTSAVHQRVASLWVEGQSHMHCTYACCPAHTTGEPSPCHHPCWTDGHAMILIVHLNSNSTAPWGVAILACSGHFGGSE
jgi:hypothetical protein